MSAAAGKPHRSGVVALLGRPNAGKSTLLNRLLGEELAIVTAKPQTTRSRILGVLTRPEGQLLFLDTPGFHSGGKALNRALHAQVDEAIQDCDVALLLIDPAHGWDSEHAELFDRLVAQSTPVVLVATKTDLTDRAATPWPPATERRAAGALRVSARSGAGVEALIEAVVPLLPEGPRYYDEDTLTDRTLRFLVAERIREAAFEALGQELPYALAVQIEEFDESREDLTRIRARILVERESQKPMVIGRGGAMVKRIGTRARQAIEAQLGTRVHLELRVKTDPRWAKDANRLKSLGYH